MNPMTVPELQKVFERWPGQPVKLMQPTDCISWWSISIGDEAHGMGPTLEDAIQTMLDNAEYQETCLEAAAG